MDLIEADREQWLREAAQSACGSVQPGVLIACCFGVLCAMAVFGYLYNNRSACMMHALPMRRETLFVTQYLAGLSFAVLPHLAVALLTTAVELALLPSDRLGPRACPPWGIWLVVQSAPGPVLLLLCRLLRHVHRPHPGPARLLRHSQRSGHDGLVPGHRADEPVLLWLCVPEAGAGGVLSPRWPADGGLRRSMGQVTVGDAAMTTGTGI